MKSHEKYEQKFWTNQIRAKIESKISALPRLPLSIVTTLIIVIYAFYAFSLEFDNLDILIIQQVWFLQIPRITGTIEMTHTLPLTGNFMFRLTSSAWLNVRHEKQFL